MDHRLEAGATLVQQTALDDVSLSYGVSGT